MKFLPLILSSLRQAKLRTALIIVSVAFAFLFYGVLAAVSKSFTGDAELTGMDRLRMVHKLTVILSLPTSYFERIAATEGVDAVTYALWFGGVYREPRNFFAKLAVERDTYFDVYPELEVPPEQLEAFRRQRTAAIAGRELAKRYGWKLGDRIPIQGTIYRRKDGHPTWEFDLVGIYEGSEENVDETQFLFRHDYLEEAAESGMGEVRWFVIRVEEPAEATRVADRLDRQFVNSPWETKTSTERAFLRAFASQIADAGALFVSITTVILFATLLVVGNSIAHSVRTRLPELATLKAIGFPERLLFGIVLGETLIVCICGALLGLGGAWLVALRGDPTPGLLSLFYVSPRDLGSGAFLAVGLALGSGTLPAFQARGVPLLRALRRG